MFQGRAMELKLEERQRQREGEVGEWARQWRGRTRADKLIVGDFAYSGTPAVGIPWGT